VAAARFLQNGYAVDVPIGGNTILYGQYAFNGDSPGYGEGTFIESVAVLGSFPVGTTIAVSLPVVGMNASEGWRRTGRLTTSSSTKGSGRTLACAGGVQSPSGWTFPVGTTTVYCTASPDFGPTAQSYFTVTVEDREPPTIVCPPDFVTTASWVR